jgi:hypothetical protein
MAEKAAGRTTASNGLPEATIFLSKLYAESKRVAVQYWTTLKRIIAPRYAVRYRCEMTDQHLNFQFLSIHSIAFCRAKSSASFSVRNISLS